MEDYNELSELAKIEADGYANEGYQSSTIQFSLLPSGNNSRSWEDIIIDWQIHTEKLDDKDFIEHLGLTDDLSQSDFSSIKSGDKIPGRNLATYLQAVSDPEVANKYSFSNKIRSTDFSSDKIVDIEEKEAEISVFNEKHPIVMSDPRFNIESDFYQMVESRLEQVVESYNEGNIDSGEEFTTKMAMNNLADHLDIDIWALKGLEPIPSHTNAAELAVEISSLILREDDDLDKFINEATNFFSDAKGIDLEQAIDEGDKDWGEVLRKLRTNVNISQKELGVLLGKELGNDVPVSYDSISDLENIPLRSDTNTEQSVEFKSIKETTAALSKIFDLEGGHKRKFEQDRWKEYDAEHNKLEENASNFGDLLKSLRSQKHLSRREFGEEIANEMGLTKPVTFETIANWENKEVESEGNVDSQLNYSKINKIIEAITNVLKLDEEQSSKLHDMRYKTHDEAVEKELSTTESFGDKLKLQIKLKHQILSEYGEELANNLNKDNPINRSTLRGYTQEKSIPDDKTLNAMADSFNMEDKDRASFINSAEEARVNKNTAKRKSKISPENFIKDKTDNDSYLSR